jgi:8-oxo-dGTP pyrophosphatase MutT (NUDIX family)
MTDAAIPAASMLLLRERPAFQVLMVERHANMKFAGGASVFPGGRIDEGDRDPVWREHASGLSEDDAIAAAMIAAVRETFEEAGVLLARRENAPVDTLLEAEFCASLAGARSEIASKKISLLDVVRDYRLTLACDGLRLFSHWVAPPGLHRRFDTLFFVARHPEGQIAQEDGDESTEIAWLAPSAAIADRVKGVRTIIFPTARNLELLALCTSIEAVYENAMRRRIDPLQPALVNRTGELWLTIPDGYGYPVLEERLESAGRG